MRAGVRAAAHVIAAVLIGTITVVAAAPTARAVPGQLGSIDWRSGWVIDGEYWPGQYSTAVKLTPDDSSLPRSTFPQRFMGLPTQSEGSLPVVDGAPYSAEFVVGYPVAAGNYGFPETTLTFPSVAFDDGQTVELLLPGVVVTTTFVDSAGSPMADLHLRYEGEVPYTVPTGDLGEGRLHLVGGGTVNSSGQFWNPLMLVPDVGPFDGVVTLATGVQLPVVVPAVDQTTTAITIVVPSAPTSLLSWTSGLRLDGVPLGLDTQLELDGLDPSTPSVMLRGTAATRNLPVIDGATYAVTSFVTPRNSGGTRVSTLRSTVGEFVAESTTPYDETIDLATVQLTVVDAAGQPVNNAQVVLDPATIDLLDDDGAVIGERTYEGGERGFTNSAGQAPPIGVPVGFGEITGRVLLRSGLQRSVHTSQPHRSVGDDHHPAPLRLDDLAAGMDHRWNPGRAGLRIDRRHQPPRRAGDAGAAESRFDRKFRGRCRRPTPDLLHLPGRPGGFGGWRRRCGSTTNSSSPEARSTLDKSASTRLRRSRRAGNRSVGPPAAHRRHVTGHWRGR